MPRRQVSKCLAWHEQNPGHSQRNLYDDELIEFWVDYRTSGEKGFHEWQGFREATSGEGAVDSMAELGVQDLTAWPPRGEGVCDVEPGKDAAP